MIRRPRRAHAQRIVIPPDAAEIAEGRKYLRMRHQRDIDTERATIPMGKIRHHGRVLLSEHFTVAGEHYYKSGIQAEAWFAAMNEQVEVPA